MNKRKKYLFISFVSLILLIMAVIIWNNLHTTKNLNFSTEKVKRGDIIQTVSANGTLNPVVLVNVGTQITGRVEKIYADFNDHVKKDQVLLELDKKLLNADIEQNDAQVKKAEAVLNLATANERRGKAIYEQHFISKQDLDQLVATRKSAAADLELAKAALAKSKTNLNYATITSPVSGVIVDRAVDVGQTVTASFQTPILFKIAQDLRKMQIDSSYAEADIGNIRTGQQVTFTVDAFPNRTFNGIVKQIRLNPTTQQNVVTYNVVIQVDNPDQTLLPGMTAYVNIKTLEHKNVLLVPNAALRYKPKAQQTKNNSEKTKPGYGIVYKLVGDKTEKVSCQLGISDGHNTEILSGKLKEDDEVIIGDIEPGQASTGSSFRVRVF